MSSPETTAIKIPRRLRWAATADNWHAFGDMPGLLCEAADWCDQQQHYLKLAQETIDEERMERKRMDALFPQLWRINDCLRLTPDGGVEFTGSQNDVEDYREALHKIDPHFSRGLSEALMSVGLEP